ncbi:MAG: hypothetical protein JNM76_07315 [Betaproteobacteria bacterium]|nr:hypothetical protein [Betaproteobacteria bacterium]
MWKQGRGLLGRLAPLVGGWEAHDDSDLGPVVCTREFAMVLDGKYLELRCKWTLTKSVYEEIALYGVNAEKQLFFASFTSDGKSSMAIACDAADVHSRAIAFEAMMPAGRARTIYWPGDDGQMHWATESATKKGWNRFVHHLYRRTGD